MRAEDKQVDGRELEREERLQESELEKDEDEEVPEVVVVEARDLAGGERALLTEAMRAIVARRTLVVNDLALPAHEKRALDALQIAVNGKDNELGAFVYAEDRSELLEQALAVLQPNIDCGAREMIEMIQRVGELRARLSSLGDAQDELMDANEQVGIEVKPPEAGDDDDTAEKPSTLSDGPDVVIEKKPSLLADSEPEARCPAPEIPTPKPDPEPQENKKPWWRRPFG